MSSIDINKLKSNLEKNGIFIIDYYTLDNKCAMLKVFVIQINQFLLIYIPKDTDKVPLLQLFYQLFLNYF